MQKFNEVVVISGKGGTGKTSIVASIVPYLRQVVIADCDVDAPDLNILFGEQINESKEFIGTKKAEINVDKCIQCNRCIDKCNFNAISDNYVVDTFKCEGCAVCELVCSSDAVTLKDVVVGHLLYSNTKYGKLVHAKLIPGEETSGKLVAAVRKEAKKTAEQLSIKNIIVDGSPGIACNVISSITGAKHVIIVIEPTLSGLHDLERVYEVTKKFNTTSSVVINKYDLSRDISNKIEDFCTKNCIDVDIKVPFNRIMVEAISHREIPSIYAKEFFNSIGFNTLTEKYFL